MRDIITLRLELTEKEVQELNHMVEEQFEHLEEDMHSMTDSISEANMVRRGRNRNSNRLSLEDGQRHWHYGRALE